MDFDWEALQCSLASGMLRAQCYDGLDRSRAQRCLRRSPKQRNAVDLHHKLVLSAHPARCAPARDYGRNVISNSVWQFWLSLKSRQSDEEQRVVLMPRDSSSGFRPPQYRTHGMGDRRNFRPLDSVIWRGLLLRATD